MELSDAAWDAGLVGERPRHPTLIEAAAPTLIANARTRTGASWPLPQPLVAPVSTISRPIQRPSNAVVGLIRGTAMDLAPYGVTANASVPVRPARHYWNASAQVYELSSAEEFAQQQPIGRLIEPVEIAAAISWLCSPAASAIHGCRRRGRRRHDGRLSPTSFVLVRRALLR